jgi:3-methyladenine DNA glycosylase/8-oxoguanine DNA glycosylase
VIEPSVREIPIEEPYDLAATLFPLRRGTGDPTMRIDGHEAWRASRTPEGPVTLRLRHEDGSIRAAAWGPGAAWGLEQAPALAGALDDVATFEPRDQIMARIWKAHRGVRLPRAMDVVRHLVAAVLEQKVVGLEARRAWRRMTYAFGEPAPGPAGLRLPPGPALVAEAPYFRFHRFGVERRRAEVLRAMCSRASELEGLVDRRPADARARLEAFVGIGPWTSGEVTRLSMGDPDAVSIGDYHLPHVVSWALAAEPRGTDDRMLELLEPYRGQRARVQRLLEASHIAPPSFGPRMEARAIERI